MVHHWPKEFLIWHCTVLSLGQMAQLSMIILSLHILTIVEPIWPMHHNASRTLVCVYIYIPICTFVVCICRHVHCSLFILISIDTYQLRSCDISSIDDNITYKCSYGNQSVLWGCGIEAVNIMNGDTNTSNTTSDNGVINGLCDGIYNVTCYGIPDTNPSTRIIYNDSKDHSLISITV